MGRLIDADKLILHLNDYALQEATFMTGGYAGKYDAIKECMKAVEEQPIAYDPDKVIEKLQVLSDKADDDIAVCEADMCQYYDGYGDGLDRAIEIVKRGGRDEE